MLQEYPLSRMRGQRNECITAFVILLRQAHQRSAPAVAEQHNGFGPTTSHFRCNRCDVDRAKIVQAVDIIVDVARRETEDGEARRR